MTMLQFVGMIAFALLPVLFYYAAHAVHDGILWMRHRRGQRHPSSPRGLMNSRHEQPPS